MADLFPFSLFLKEVGRLTLFPLSYQLQFWLEALALPAR